ncbi:MAG: hypothetical protein ACXVAN_13435, partial [Polyangia bacterium]
MQPRPFRAAFALAFASAAPAAVLTALVDLGVTAVRSGEPIGVGAFASAGLAALGLYGALAALLALGEAIVGGGLSATLAIGPSLRRFVDGARRDASYDRGAAAGIAAVALALGVVGAIVLGYDGAIAMQMAAKRNAALTTAMVAVVAVPIGALAWFPLYRLCRALVAVVPRPRALVVLGALVALALLIVVAAVLSVDWRIIDFGPAESLALFFASQAIVAFVLSSRRRPPAPAAIAGAWAMLAVC